MRSEFYTNENGFVDISGVPSAVDSALIPQNATWLATAYPTLVCLGWILTYFL